MDPNLTVGELKVRAAEFGQVIDNDRRTGVFPFGHKSRAELAPQPHVDGWLVNSDAHAAWLTARGVYARAHRHGHANLDVFARRSASAFDGTRVGIMAMQLSRTRAPSLSEHRQVI